MSIQYSDPSKYKWPSICAAFADPAQAESAAGALLDHGIRAECISLVVSQHHKSLRGTIADPELNYTQPVIISGPAGATNRFDPLGNDLRVAAPMLMGANNGPVGESAELNLGPDLTSDQSIPTEFVSATNKKHPTSEPEEPVSIATHESGAPEYDHEIAAKRGLTTTTPEDASHAAKHGLAIGFGVGTLAAVATLTIPGFGVVIGGGALAAALAAIAATTGAGAVAGGVFGYLKDQGVPAKEIEHYEKIYAEGGALLAVHLDKVGEEPKIEAILRKYGAQQTERYGYIA